MTKLRFVRISGLALLLGAAAFIVHIVSRSMITAGSDPISVAKSGLWVPLNGLGVFGAGLVLLGLPGMYIWIARRTGVLELVGLLLFAFSWMFLGLFLSIYGMLLLPWLADKAPSLVALTSPLPLALVVTFVVALGAQLLGMLLLAIALIRNRVNPLWVSCLLPASAVWSLIGSLIIAPGDPATNLAVNLLSNLGPVLFLTATSYLGWQMRSGRAMSDRTCME